MGVGDVLEAPLQPLAVAEARHLDGPGREGCADRSVSTLFVITMTTRARPRVFAARPTA
jgi:hypothetical protein